MSSPKTLIINCGASRVTAAITSSPGHGELTLERFTYRDLDYDYSEDGDWLETCIAAIGELIREEKLPEQPRIIAPGFRLLTKTIKVPTVEQSKQAQIIVFEAQQNIPYPLEEVVWDSQVVSDDGVETEVLFIAIKRETINGFCNGLSGAGVKPEAIDAASILDYNTFRFCYPEVTDDVLLINIGARASNLMFIGQSGFFVRNLQLGGNSLTQNIADSLGTSFNQAEDVKVRFFSGEEEYDESDSRVKPLLENADNFMKRMSTEITRSIVTYRRQNDGKAPTQIYLSGRASLLSGLTDFLSEKQRVSVDYLDPTRNVGVDGKIPQEELNHGKFTLSEIIGEAVRPLLDGEVGVDLLPAQIRSRLDFAKRKVFLALGAVAFAVATFLPWLAFQRSVEVLEEQKTVISRQVVPLREVSADVSEVREEAQEVKDSIEKIDRLVRSRLNWILFFSQLQGALQAAGDVWLDSMDVARERVGGRPDDRRRDRTGARDRASEAETSYRLNIVGRILIRDSSETGEPIPVLEGIERGEITSRARRVVNSILESEFVVDAENLTLQWGEQFRNLVPFSFTLVIDPDRPL
jgi:type IV pilus assembly protein PilM